LVRLREKPERRTKSRPSLQHLHRFSHVVRQGQKNWPQ
jgi:hypothetical protein